MRAAPGSSEGSEMDAVRKEKLGQKYSCFECGSKFYDLKRAEPVCPRCGVDQRKSPALKAPKKGRRAKKATRWAVPVVLSDAASPPKDAARDSGLTVVEDPEDDVSAALDGDLDLDDDLDLQDVEADPEPKDDPEGP